MAKKYKIYLGIVNASKDELTTNKGINTILHDIKIDIFNGVTRSIITPSKDADTAFHEFADFIATALTNDVITVDDTIELMDYAVERAKEVEIEKGSDD